MVHIRVSGSGEVSLMGRNESISLVAALTDTSLDHRWGSWKNPTGWILLFGPLKESFRIEVGLSVCDLSLRRLLAGTIFHAAALKRLTPLAWRRRCGLLTRETCWGAKVTLAVWTLTHTQILTDATSRQHRRAVMTAAVSWLVNSQPIRPQHAAFVGRRRYFSHLHFNRVFFRSVIGWWEWLMVLFTKFSAVQNCRNSQLCVNDNKMSQRF